MSWPAIEAGKTCFNPDRDLTKIRSFDYNNGVIPPEEHNVYGRTELVRFLVLEHGLQGIRADVFYADFDIVDVKLDDPHLESSLQKFGVSAALTPYNQIENSFLAFRRDTMDQAFFNNIVAAVELNVKNGYGGFGPFYKLLKSWACHKTFSCESSLARKLAPPMGTPFPRPARYKDFCIES